MFSRFDVRRHVIQPRLRRRWIIVVLVVLLSMVPLVGTLGYENGFVLSPVLAGLGLAVGVDGVTHVRTRGIDGRAQLRALVVLGGVQLGILLGLTLGILFLAQLWHRNCDVWGGLAFFLMGPGLSAVMGWVAGLWGGALAQRRWKQLAIAGLIVALSTGVGLWRLWADPVIFAYDPFWGYYSGAIYDEAVSIGSTYLVFRAYNVWAAIAALGLWHGIFGSAVFRPHAAGGPNAAIGLGLVVSGVGGVALWVGLHGASMGFTANVASITEVLSAERQTEHFVIHFNPRSATARSIDAVAADHELAWHELQRVMGRAPEGKVHSFVFINAAQKRGLMGAGTVQVAAPWRQQIYLDERGWPHPVLPHELAHVFGKTIGDPIFGVSIDGIVPNIALIEGFATALAPRASDRLDLHDQVTVLERLGKRPPLDAIMGPAFFTRSSRVAYTTAGSFCRWLIETRGFEPMAVLYRSGGDFIAAYDEPLDSLQDQWLQFLNQRQGVTDDDVKAHEQRYQRRSIFQRPCAHRAATVLEDIAQAQAQGRWPRAIEGFRELCEIEPQTPEHKLGLALSLAVAHRFEEALAVLDAAIAMPELTVTVQAQLLERRADVAMAAQELDVAHHALVEALERPMSQGQRRGLLLKRRGSEDPALAPLVVDYYLMFDTAADGVTGAIRRVFAAQQIRELPGYEALGSYLLGRQLLNVQFPGGARALLEQAIAASGEGHGLPGPEFLREARWQLVHASAQTGHLDQADALLDTLQAESGLGNGHQLRISQWRARVAFLREHDRKDRQDGQ